MVKFNQMAQNNKLVCSKFQDSSVHETGLTFLNLKYTHTYIYKHMHMNTHTYHYQHQQLVFEVLCGIISNKIPTASG